MITALKVPALNKSGNRSQRLPSAGNVAHGAVRAQQRIQESNLSH